MALREEALEYHKKGRPGKLEIGITKPCKTQKDITLAYSPGVGEPCKEIAKDPNAVFDYTVKSNLVAVITNGTAVLGLGNIGPLAAKPVMEGKAVLFKMFADIDCFDIELNAPSIEEVVSACKMLEPTFGGINLEDIASPHCFAIEERLRKELNIPVFHDDQHGTAIVSGAALLNALEIIGKEISKIRVVVNGAGAAGTACAKMYLNLGVRPEHLFMCDRDGVIRSERQFDDLNQFKVQFANDSGPKTLAEALVGADMFCGCSVAGVLTRPMIAKMAPNPIIFAMANPDPEINPKDALAERPDAIIATGRSDFPNQVNNVLGYPYIFRGALDVHAKQINEEMKMAAVRALADLAKEDVPDAVSHSYANEKCTFGREYLIPKPFDHRLLLKVAPAVAKAAMETGVARRTIQLDDYIDTLEERLGVAYSVTRKIKRSISSIARSQGKLKRVVLPEGHSSSILRAAAQVVEEGICKPVLIGNEHSIRDQIKSLKLDSLVDVEIVEPATSPHIQKYAQEFFKKRCRKGITRSVAHNLLEGNTQYFATMMLECGDADVYLSGAHHNYADALKPALEIIGAQEGKILAGVYLVLWKDKSLVFADTTINIDPDPVTLAQIAIEAHDFSRSYLNEKPRVAMLSYSNFGSSHHGEAQKVRRAAEVAKHLRPDIEIEGEVHADVALSLEIMAEHYPFSALKGPANVLVFPNLSAGNIAYKLLQKLGNATIIGPLLIGMNKPVHILQRNATVEEIVHMITFTVHRA